MKKVYLLCVLTCAAMALLAFAVHRGTAVKEQHIKVGFIFVGDEITPYTNNFINARKHVEEVFGDKIECVTKYNVGEEMVLEPLLELVDEKCDYIIAASYGYGPTVKSVAAEHPDIEFCVPTGDNANVAPVLSNYHTCMGTIYQGRYLCGVVAGVKLREMIDTGVITPEQAKLGYVAAFPYPEVISGFTAFYLGVYSIVPEATMLVKYTDTWSNYSIEKQYATELIRQGCVIISQHSDTIGPATACETSEGDIPVYHVGYNQSMTDVAPTSSLVSCTIDYSYYFEQSIGALIKGKKIEDCIDGKVVGQDCMAGIEKDWVRILDMNSAIVPQKANSVLDDVEENMLSGKTNVFFGPFTGVNPYDETDTIDLTTPYIENKTSSSPTFKYILDDVITVIE